MSDKIIATNTGAVGGYSTAYAGAAPFPGVFILILIILLILLIPMFGTFGCGGYGYEI